jgi:hypothetical protein
MILLTKTAKRPTSYDNSCSDSLCFDDTQVSVLPFLGANRYRVYSKLLMWLLQHHIVSIKLDNNAQEGWLGSADSFPN